MDSTEVCFELHSLISRLGLPGPTQMCFSRTLAPDSTKTSVERLLRPTARLGRQCLHKRTHCTRPMPALTTPSNGHSTAGSPLSDATEVAAVADQPRTLARAHAHSHRTKYDVLAQCGLSHQTRARTERSYLDNDHQPVSFVLRSINRPLPVTPPLALQQNL